MKLRQRRMMSRLLNSASPVFLIAFRTYLLCLTVISAPISENAALACSVKYRAIRIAFAIVAASITRGSGSTRKSWHRNTDALQRSPAMRCVFPISFPAQSLISEYSSFSFGSSSSAKASIISSASGESVMISGSLGYSSSSIFLICVS